MKRRDRGALVNVGLFLIALFAILYLGSPSKPSSSPQLFAWGKIRYESSAHELPPSRGICPGLSAEVSKPVLVVARTVSESASWLDELSSTYHICPYTADAKPNPDSVHLQTPANRGHESMAYLTFIIDNYDKLPSTGVVFVHGSRFAWHNDDPVYDNLSLLKQLNVHRALWGPPGVPTGYWNLKCDWSAGMCNANSADAKPQGSLETRTRYIIEKGNRRAESDVALVEALAVLFGDNERGKGKDKVVRFPTTLGRSDAVRSQCCAQFVVARENIWKRSKAEYVALRQWLLDTGEDRSGQIDQVNADQQRYSYSQNQQKAVRNKPAPADDLVAGRVISYIWHILFLPSSSEESIGQSDGDASVSANVSNGLTVDLNHLNRLACPSAEECYCRLYGRCNLAGCTTPGRCRGQYIAPPDYRLPKDWADEHS